MYYAIDSDKLYTLIQDDIQIIDLRDSFNYNNLHVINSINIPHDQFNEQLLSKNKPILLICYSGKIAKKEAERLNHLGYHTYYLQDGFSSLIKQPSKYY